MEPMKLIADTFGKLYDDLVSEAFARYGYTKDWLLIPANRNRIRRNVFTESGVDEWLIDGIVLFSVKRETCMDPSVLGLTIRLTLEYRIGNFPEKTVTCNGFE